MDVRVEPASLVVQRQSAARGGDDPHRRSTSRRSPDLFSAGANVRRRPHRPALLRSAAPISRQRDHRDRIDGVVPASAWRSLVSGPRSGGGGGAAVTVTRRRLTATRLGRRRRTATTRKSPRCCPLPPSGRASPTAARRYVHPDERTLRAAVELIGADDPAPQPELDQPAERPAELDPPTELDYAPFTQSAESRDSFRN